MGNGGGFHIWLSPNFTERGEQIDQLITILHIFMAVLFIGWGVFLAYCLYRFRARPGHEASYKLPKAKSSKYIEIGVAAFEAFLLLGFAIPIWAQVKDAVPAEKDEGVVTIRVVAQQFAWNFLYPGANGKFGKAHLELMGPQNPFGIDRENDPDGADDLWSTDIFAVPVDKNIRMELMSKDVIHSFSIPMLRVKQDIIPGMKIVTWFNVKPEAAGETHQIHCAQLCGLGHGSMKGTVLFRDDAGYQAWLDEQASFQIESDDDWGDEGDDWN